MRNVPAEDWRGQRAACEHNPSLVHASRRGQGGLGSVWEVTQGKSFRASGEDALGVTRNHAYQRSII